MNATPIRIWTADDGGLLVTFEPELTSAMLSDLNTYLDGHPTNEEAMAVLQGLAEDWKRTIRVRPGAKSMSGADGQA